MAGRVLRSSNGRFAGSTRGWKGSKVGRALRSAARGPVAKANQTKGQIVRHTVKRSTFAGLRGIARSAGRAAISGAKASLIPAATVVGVSIGASKRYGVPIATSIKPALKAGGVTLGVGVLSGIAMNTHPVQSFRNSAMASAETGLSNRAAAALRGKTGQSKKYSYQAVYKGTAGVKGAVNLAKVAKAAASR